MTRADRAGRGSICDVISHETESSTQPSTTHQSAKGVPSSEAAITIVAELPACTTLYVLGIVLNLSDRR